MSNLLLTTDSYKASHFLGYPKDTEGMYAYLEAREGSRYPETVFFGLQAALERILGTPFTLADIKEAESFWKAHGEPFDVEGWLYILYQHGGRLPVRICAVPEGSVVPVGNCLMTVESTDPRVPWVVTFLETALLRGIWYPSTVATRSRACKKVILEHLRKSGTPDQIDFKLHDFGARGVSSGESAELGGMAHLVNFKGTDTVEGIIAASHYYDTGICGYSIPAMEHSTVMAWGPTCEVDAFSNMLQQHRKRGFKMVACVSDTYNLFNAVESIWCGSMLEEVKESGMTVVIRPDSGDAAAVNVRILEIMRDKLGDELKRNAKGYLVLPSYYRVIQGDGNDDETSIDRVLTAIEAAGFSADNLAFGMGGGLLQQVNRDTQRMAYKISQITLSGGVHMDVAKNPVTDPSKRSKAGRVALYQDPQTKNYLTSTEKPLGHVSALATIWDRTLINRTTFDEIRARAAVGL